MKKWKDCFQYRHYLFKRHHVWLDKEINIQDISSEPRSGDNTNKDLINSLFRTLEPLMSSFRKIAHYMQFLIFVPHPHSNAALCVTSFVPVWSFDLRTRVWRWRGFNALETLNGAVAECFCGKSWLVTCAFNRVGWPFSVALDWARCSFRRL